ncbi:hypothetical protein Z043_110588, partial [Scleropages formosus]
EANRSGANFTRKYSGEKGELGGEAELARCDCHLFPLALAAPEPPKGEEPSTSSTMAPTAPGSAPSPQSEAVTNELQELSLQAGPTLLPLRERKN